MTAFCPIIPYHNSLFVPDCQLLLKFPILTNELWHRVLEEKSKRDVWLAKMCSAEGSKTGKQRLGLSSHINETPRRGEMGIEIGPVIPGHSPNMRDTHRQGGEGSSPLRLAFGRDTPRRWGPDGLSIRDCYRVWLQGGRHAQDDFDWELQDAKEINHPRCFK